MPDRCPVCGNVGRNRTCHPSDDATSRDNLAPSDRLSAEEIGIAAIHAPCPTCGRAVLAVPERAAPAIDRERAEREVQYLILRAGWFRPTAAGQGQARTAAGEIVLTVLQPELRWDIDEDHLTPEHRAILAALAASPDPREETTT